MEASADLLPERLQRRGRELQLERQRKKQDREQEDGSNRKAVNYFLDQFAKNHLEIESDLSKLASGMVEKSLIPSTISKISQDIQTLQKYFSASTMVLCLHDVRKSQERIQLLQQTLQELEEKFLPKKKFGFKARKAFNRDTGHVKVVDETDGEEALKKILTDNDFGIKDKVNENIVMRANSVSDKDVVLTNVTGCTVKLMGSPGTLHMTNIKDCTIMSGPVARSVFLDNCKNCKFNLACQQLRVHRTNECDFYLHVTSRAIIEDTQSVRFAPYNWNYEGLDQDLAKLGWDMKKNHWDSVDDFNWLASDKPSPNWCILPVNERLSWS